ncbi:MAG: PQQ-dependent sugar dehydrogenase, partial [Actinomadura sp.]
SDTEFYYAHLSTDNTILPHNGTFVVHNADRQRIEDQWDPVRSIGAPPAVTDADWHRVRVVHCAGSGEIAVYLDGSDKPLMTTVDTTFGSGRIGFGSFDNIGRIRNLTVTGTPVGD